jgi:hypothetical protein
MLKSGQGMKPTKHNKIGTFVVAASVGVVALHILPVTAQEAFYSVDFNSPLNQVGNPPVTGMGSSTPSSIVFGTPTVESSFGSLTDQPLVFSAIGYQQIQFDLSKGVPDYFVDFDFETHNLNPSLFAFMLLFDTPYVQNFYLHGSGYIGVPPANSPYLAGWSDDELHHMHIAIDIPNSSWTFQIDDEAPAIGAFSSGSGDILSLRMNLSTWRQGTPDDPNVQVAIDNVVIGTPVPEPTSMSLFYIAGGLLFVRRWYKCFRMNQDERHFT